MMRRPAHGATRRPPLERPGNGFGRATRPRPPAAWRDVTTLAAIREWDPAELLIADANESRPPRRHPTTRQSTLRSGPNYAVMSCRACVSAGVDPPPPPACAIISFVMSPWTRTLPAMNACMPGLLVARDEHVLGGVDVGRERDVGAVGVALAEHRGCRPSRPCGTRSSCRRRRPRGSSRGSAPGGAVGAVLGDELRGRVEPFVGEERVLVGHWSLLRVRRSTGRAGRVELAVPGRRAGVETRPDGRSRTLGHGSVPRGSSASRRTSATRSGRTRRCASRCRSASTATRASGTARRSSARSSTTASTS